MNNDYWKNKINAFLHDPFDKAIIITSRKIAHEERANQILKKFNITKNNDIEDLIILADHISAGIDRPVYEEIKDIDIRKIERITTINPLTGDKLSKSFELIDKEKILERIEDLINKSIQMILDKLTDKNDYKNLFFSIWASYPEILALLDKDIGEAWKYLPADTRLPYHSLFTHLQSTSAVFSSLPNLGFLYFSLGPVQDFIETSRKTQDLWASSLLLSYLSWKGIEVIFDEVGPDHICYPYLKNQGFVLKKLKGLIPDELIPEELNDKLLIPSLPNKFLAIIPFEIGEELGKKVSDRINLEFKDISSFIFSQFLEFLKSLKLNSQEIEKIEKQWNEQVNNFLEINYIIFPWSFKTEHPGDFEKQDVVIRYINNLINTLYPEDNKNEIQEIFTNLNNIGCTYGFNFGILERIMGARKTLRNFQQIEQTGDKCSLCGKNAALYPYSEFDRRSKYRNFWKSLSQQTIDKGKVGLFKDDGSERLCAIEVIKRMFTEFYQNISSSKKIFPSTYSISVTTFLDKAIDTQEGKNLFLKISDIDKEKSGYYPKLLYNKIKPIKKSEIPDGSYFFISELQNLEDVNVKEVIKEIREFKKKYKAIYNYLLPYYAIIKFDGDNMGKWISGEIQEFPKISYVIHDECVEKLESSDRLRGILDKKLPVSSALHLFISMNLCDFSQNKVPFIVDKNYGSLVYSGGDDVLAFAPVEYVFDMAKEIRIAFSEPEAMGRNATGSAGIVIAHASTPLNFVLNKVREAERKAKLSYKDKDAFNITLIKGSGSESSIYGKWFYESKNKDTICSLDFIKILSVLFDIEGADLKYLRNTIYKDYFQSFVGKIYFSPSIVKDIENEHYYLNDKEEIINRIETLIQRHASFVIEPIYLSQKEKIKEFKENGLKGIKNIIFDFVNFYWNKNEETNEKHCNTLRYLLEFMKIARFISRKGGE